MLSDISYSITSSSAGTSIEYVPLLPFSATVISDVYVSPVVLLVATTCISDGISDLDVIVPFITFLLSSTHSIERFLMYVLVLTSNVSSPSSPVR